MHVITCNLFSYLQVVLVQDKWFEMKLDLKELRSVEQMQIDAFTSHAFGGNPAAVIFEHRDAEWMQNVAMENNLAETSFLSKVEGLFATYNLRWYAILSIY